jgi:protein TonB
VRNILPEYPEEARRGGQEGLVVLSVEVLKDGSVGRIEIITSSGYPLLDDSAIRAVKRWQFTPATVNGQPTESTIKIPIRFRLQ